MGPFDLPGPQFLALYAVLVALGFLLAWLLRRSARAPRGTSASEKWLEPAPSWPAAWASDLIRNFVTLP
jgi:hypothetical protein